MASADRDDLAHCLARRAAASLVAEARLTPKPGLVDAVSTGAHTDMDLSTFLTSAAALEPHFERYLREGMAYGRTVALADADRDAAVRIGPAEASELADRMRRLGIHAERAMFDATADVNTHKGANFTFALILGATGAQLGSARSLPFAVADTQELLRIVSLMGESLLDHDVRALRQRAAGHGVPDSQHGDPVRGLSHGERLLLERGMQGVRGEAAQGYPQLRRIVLPYLRSACGTPVTDPAQARIILLRCLVKIMASLEDTNVVHRGGPQALVDHRAFCRTLDHAELPASELVRALAAYDAELTRRNVSPGGAADLLALGIFFAQLEGLMEPSALSY